MELARLRRCAVRARWWLSHRAGTSSTAPWTDLINRTMGSIFNPSSNPEWHFPAARLKGACTTMIVGGLGAHVFFRTNPVGHWQILRGLRDDK
eukprot:9471194-Pyramimonas_sp.AAC.1